jgi:hypothetical protein
VMTINLGNFNVIDSTLNALLKVQGGPGVNTLAPSLLVDDGNTLTYNGVPVGGSVITPLAAFYVDGTYTGVSTGAQETPFKTIGSALAACSGTGPYSIFIAGGTYTDAGPIVGSTAQLQIYGNNATWTVAGGVTLNGPATVYDLNTIGPVTYAYAGSTRSERHGGSFATGNVIINGFVHWYGVQLTNTGGLYSVTVSGTLAGDFITGGMQIKSGGASAFIALNNINLQKASGYNFDMTLGGILAIKGGYLTTVAGTFNIYVPTANSVATSHAIEDITFITGNGVSANGAAVYTGWANLSIPPSTALCPAFYALYNPWPVIAQPWVAQTAKTASIVSSTVFTAPLAGLYRITGSVRTTTAGSAGTVSITTAGQISGTADLTVLNSTVSSTTTSYLAAGGTFAVSTTVSGNTGGQYRADYFVERVGQ